MNNKSFQDPLFHTWKRCEDTNSIQTTIGGSAVLARRGEIDMIECYHPATGWQAIHRLFVPHIDGAITLLTS